MWRKQERQRGLSSGEGGVGCAVCRWWWKMRERRGRGLRDHIERHYWYGCKCRSQRTGEVGVFRDGTARVLQERTQLCPSFALSPRLLLVLFLSGCQQAWFLDGLEFAATGRLNRMTERETQVKCWTENKMLYKYIKVSITQYYADQQTSYARTPHK